jgi:hypothetical protein
MGRSGSQWILGVTATLAAFATAGCRDSGLPDRNLPLADAETRRFSYEVYQPRDEAETVFRHDQADWVVAGEPQRIPASHLVSAGSAEGRALFALVTDAAPYDRLYVETAGAWTPFARVN